jgi:hypothetical protein
MVQRQCRFKDTIMVQRQCRFQLTISPVGIVVISNCSKSEVRIWGAF